MWENRAQFAEFFDDFLGNPQFSATPGAGPWVIDDTSAAGTPTFAVVTPSALGELALTLVNTSEAENLALGFGDVLAFDIAKLRWFECRVKLSGVLTSVQTACFGMVGAQNDTNTTMNGCLFNIVGDGAANTLVCRTKNATLTVNQASAAVLGTAYRTLAIDLADKRNVKFYVGDGAEGQLSRLLPNPTAAFDFSAYTGSLQPLVQLNKASGTTTPAVTIDYVYIKAAR